MATPTQRSQESVISYIHNVSPVKSSKKDNKYFNMTLQIDKNEFHDAICFSADKREKFSQVATKKTPVKLRNINKVPSMKPSGQYDIQISKQTLMEELKDCEFKLKEPPCALEKTIASLKSSQVDELVTISVKVMYLDKGSPRLTRNGSLVIYSSIVADATDSITLTFWESCRHKIDIENSYKLCEVKLCEYNGERSLMLGNFSQVSKIEDIKTIEKEKLPPPPSQKQVSGNVACIDVSVSNKCSKCVQTVDFNERDETVKCKNLECRMRQKSVDLLRVYDAKLGLSGSNEVYMIPSYVLSTFCKEMNKSDILLHDLEDAENYFMSLSVILDIGSKNVVTKINIQPPA